MARTAVIATAVAIAYVIAAQIGFRVAFVAEQVTTVWAPTGIALAALLIWGPRLWPAIWLAAFLVNARTDAPLWTAPVLATGNTLEAVIAAHALQRLTWFAPTFERVADVVAFGAIGVVLSPTVSATVGVVTLCTAGVQPWARFEALWFDWWLGDALGALVVAPAILTSVPWRTWSRRQWAALVVFLAATVAITQLVFGRLPDAHVTLEYAVFPIVIAAAMAGGPPLASIVVLGASAITIWHSVHGAGPFAGPELHATLVLLQTFMGILAGTALLLAAAVAERSASEQRERAAARGLGHREEMLRLAQRAGGVATFEWDFEHQIARCSTEFFRIFGLPDRDGIMPAANWARFVHPDDRDRMAVHLTRALAGAEPAVADYRIIHTDGSVRWLSYAGQLQKTPDGNRMLGTVVDITDRKRLETELRHHAAEVERILETIGEGFVALDRELRYVYVNQSAERILGRIRTEMIGRTPWDVFPAPGAHEWRERLEAALVSGSIDRFEVHVPGWDRWFENRIYGSGDGLSIFFADVTARIKADAALRESRDVLSLAMRGGSMGAWSRNLVTNEVWWSAELEEIVGLPPGAFAGSEASFFDLVHPDDREAVQAAVTAAVDSGADYIVEFRFRHAGGEWRWMEGRGLATYAADGTPANLYGIGIDVTARKRTELALQEAKEAAEAANQLKDHFLATLSHELRTPLNAILGYAHMLQTNAIAPEKRQRAIDIIERNAVAQNQLVEELLDVSRIATGKVRLDPEPIPVAALLGEAIEGIKPAAEAKQIALDVQLDPFAGAVIADRTRLQQVFWNLLTNAVKFTDPSGRVVASLRREGGYVEISIADTGAGISPEFLPFVFEPFRQADGRPGGGHGGLGLGLAISKQLVELHGGTIRAASTGAGQGSTFVIRLPRRHDAAPLAEDTPERGLRVVGDGKEPAL
jgi:PAS domain S-box-containing protein